MIKEKGEIIILSQYKRIQGANVPFLGGLRLVRTYFFSTKQRIIVAFLYFCAEKVIYPSYLNIMVKQNSIKLFEEKKVRTVWDSEQEEWYFSVIDVVAVLTESPNPSDYLKKVKKRDEELAKGWGQIVTPLSIPTNGGNQRTNCANLKGIFRIIQSIPSPKAEPFKQWMAQQQISTDNFVCSFYFFTIKKTVQIQYLCCFLVN